jgi:hypothetical protein
MDDAGTNTFHYSAPARRRAFLLGIPLLAMTGLLLAVMVLRWAEWGFSTRAVSLLLAVTALFALRAQLGRSLFRMTIDTEGVAISAPLSNRRFTWQQITRVQRVELPQFSQRAGRWICALWTTGRSGHPRRHYLFDSEVERGAEALALIEQHVARARQRGVEKVVE